MFSKLRKNKLLFYILSTIVFAGGSFSYWYDFFVGERKMGWLGGVIFGIMAIIKLVDSVEEYRRRKVAKLGKE